MPEKQALLITAGGQIQCRRCQGMSRRTGLQCGAPAEQHSEKCRFHGSRATGPTTLEGLERCARAKLQGKGDTRSQRKLASVSSALTRLCAQLVKDHSL
jgi:hypothetical protein